MKIKNDLFCLLFLLLLFLPFVVSPVMLAFFEDFTRDHGIIASFVKFAILATTGELIGLRIRTGSYFKPGFGVLPRAIVWGFLGITIYMAFAIFSKGTAFFLSGLGVDVESQAFGNRLILAFCISTFMNLIYAPVMMTFHKITDTHILNNGGKTSSLLKAIPFVEILQKVDWKTQWEFVFQRTIPFFWVPAHTITFLLPPEYRVLFAAILGIMLGVILAFANAKGREKGIRLQDEVKLKSEKGS
ncbi:MAG: Mpv17/PMP22 family protein [Bacteroidales bacterium]